MAGSVYDTHCRKRCEFAGKAGNLRDWTGSDRARAGMTEAIRQWPGGPGKPDKAGKGIYG